MADLNRLESYDYFLPPKLIARYPLPERDHSRLMVLERKTNTVHHRKFSNFPELLEPGDCLVLNQTKVLAARLLGTRKETGGKWEGLFLKAHAADLWELIAKTRGKPQVGETIQIDPVDQNETETLELTLVDQTKSGGWKVQPKSSLPFSDDPTEILSRFGTMPLPPYIGRTIADKSDWDRYQTTYASSPGAVAAPTAGLHFTPEILKQCEEKGVKIACVTLHVGIGTFRPIGVSDISNHTMHSEWCEVSQDAVELINTTRENGGSIVAVGTTTVRSLESAATGGGEVLKSFCGPTELFIRPGYQFQVVDQLLTNFHLPCSSLLVMISALAGYQQIKDAYQEAIREQYRFYSYGDAMLIT